MPLPQPAIVVLGGAALDMIAQVTAFPPPDGNAVVTCLTRAPGGVGANIAVALTRLWQAAALMGVTGDDDIAINLRAGLQAAGVDVRALRTQHGVATHSCFIAVNPTGERIIFGLPGVLALEHVALLDLDLLRAARALHIAPAYREAALGAIAAARAAQLHISYTPGDVQWPEGPAAVRTILEQVDLLILNRVEAAALTGEHEPAAALRILRTWTPARVALTLGRAGVLLAEGDTTLYMSAFRAPEVRDSTGAGYAFAAGLLTGILEGRTFAAAAQFGAATAALKVRQSGAQLGLPTYAEVTTFMADPDNLPASTGGTW